MTFVCIHGQRQGRRCWQCAGYAKVVAVRDFDDADILRFVAPRLRSVAKHSLLDRLDNQRKAQLILSLLHLPKANTSLTRK